jgi:hypothetical protein
LNPAVPSYDLRKIEQDPPISGRSPRTTYIKFIVACCALPMDQRIGSSGVISRVWDALIVSSNERLGLPSPAHPLERMWNMAGRAIGGMTASVEEVGSSKVSV